MANLSSYLPGGIDPAAVTITGGTINGTTIGASTPSTGAFTTFTSTGIDDNATSTAITIDSSQNVGIGTTAPAVRLDVSGGLIRAARGGGEADTSYGALQFTVDGAQHAMIASENSYNLKFITNTTERMRIDSSGNVGIGVTNPASYDDFGTKNLAIGDSSGQGTLQIISSTTGTGRFWFSDGTGGSAYNGGMEYNHNNNYLNFYTNSAQKMRIDSSGNLLVGTSTTISAGDEGIQLGSNGAITTARNQTSTQTHMVFVNPNGTVGSVTTLTNSTAFNTSSDQRLKENIVDAPAGNIDAIRVRSFDWKADGSHQTYGMIAQELVDVAPEAVSKGETEDDMWGVDYSKLVPMMIKEIQDLKAEVAALKGA